MKSNQFQFSTSPNWLALAFVLASGGLHAQSDDRLRSTWDLLTTKSNLTAGLPDGESVNLRGNIPFSNGDNLQVDLLKERRFGDSGGVAGAAYTANFSPDWYGIGTLVLGHGGPNWANVRMDAQLSRKWLDRKQFITSVALYNAQFDDNRSDSGLRLSAAWYFDAPAVLEGGVILNRSQPGSVSSHMPYVALTLGREGSQYLSFRATRGTEAYQAIGSVAQLVNFESHSVAAAWRYWVTPRAGFTLQGEQYSNPSYERRTFGAGVFFSW